MTEVLEVHVPARGRHLAIGARLLAKADGADAGWPETDESMADLAAALWLETPGRPASAFVLGVARLAADHGRVLMALEGAPVLLVFGNQTPLRRRVKRVKLGPALDATPPVALNLNADAPAAVPLWLLPSGAFAAQEKGPAASAAAATEVLVRAARWVSSRTTSTFARLYPPGAFHPDRALRGERLSVRQGRGMLAQLDEVLSYFAADGEVAAAVPAVAAQTRSACLTLLCHLLATAADDPSFTEVADEAAAAMFALAAAERAAEHGRPELHAHAARLLQLRGPALREVDQARALKMVRSLVRVAPPYAELDGDWNFALCFGAEFKRGSENILIRDYGFKKIDAPEGAPQAPNARRGGGYVVLEAPFKTPHGKPLRLYSRRATPYDENHEMSQPFFFGMLINRHSQLGSFDMRAATVKVVQRGYKFMLNGQCAGLTTRFAITQMFPDADIYSSWDSTYFRNWDGEVRECEVLDCFVAALKALVDERPHQAIADEMRRKQWHHKQASAGDYYHFIGPSHPSIIARFDDLNRDGRADCYDGFLDFFLQDIAERMHDASTPRDPGVNASQIGGEAADGLNWAAGSLNRVAQYSDIWRGLRDHSDLFYAFQSAGFYDQTQPPQDVALLPHEPPVGELVAVCRYRDSDDAAGLRGEVMMHSYFSHAPRELKRLFCAADALHRAIDHQWLRERDVEVNAGRRAALLLTLAGLLKYPADQNQLDALWSSALKRLRLPPLSRSLVSHHITDGDRELSNYYGSRGGVHRLLKTLRESEPVAYQILTSDDPAVGRAAPIAIAAWSKGSANAEARPDAGAGPAPDSERDPDASPDTKPDPDPSVAGHEP